MTTQYKCYNCDRQYKTVAFINRNQLIEPWIESCTCGNINPAISENIELVNEYGELYG